MHDDLASRVERSEGLTWFPAGRNMQRSPAWINPAVTVAHEPSRCAEPAQNGDWMETLAHGRYIQAGDFCRAADRADGPCCAFARSLRPDGGATRWPSPPRVRNQRNKVTPRCAQCGMPRQRCRGAMPRCVGRLAANGVRCPDGVARTPPALGAQRWTITLRKNDGDSSCAARAEAEGGAKSSARHQANSLSKSAAAAAVVTVSVPAAVRATGARAFRPGVECNPKFRSGAQTHRATTSAGWATEVWLHNGLVRGLSAMGWVDNDGVLRDEPVDASGLNTDESCVRRPPPRVRIPA